MQAVLLKTASLPVLDGLPALPWRQVFFTAAFTLPFAAIAAVTRGLGQAILATLAGCVVLSSTGSFLFRAGGVPNWGDLAWIRTTAVFASVGAGAVSIVLLQYTRRWTLVCRLLVPATAAVSRYSLRRAQPLR